MGEASSVNDSLPVFWGEMLLSNTSPRNTEQLWQPINEHKELMKPKSTSSKMNEKWIDDYIAAINKKGPKYDPVGQHLIKLRECHFQLSLLLDDAKKEKRKFSFKRSTKNSKCERKIFPPPIPVPEFPLYYPFSETLEALHKNKQEVKIHKRFLGEDEVKEEIKSFVESVVAQSGYFIDDQQNDATAIWCLCDMTNQFLKGFINDLRRNKDSEVFSQCDDLFNPLETTLHGIKFGGISGLHKFYYERVVWKHDFMLKECEDMSKTYVQLISDLK